MSYRSIKRVLGETSLERKTRFLLGGCLMLLITASFWLYSFQTERIVTEQDRNTGYLLTLQEMQIRHFRSLASERDQMTVETVKKLTEILSDQPYDFKLILPNPPKANPEEDDDFVRDDAFGQELLRQFPKNRPTTDAPSDRDEYRIHWAEDRAKYFYYQPIRAKNSMCFNSCHQLVANVLGQEGLQGAGVGNCTAEAEGDLMAIARLTFDTKKTRDAILVNRMILLGMAIITVFLAMIASYIIVRYVIVKPLRHLRDVSDAISRGDSTLRADLHTGDEFEELAVAFNRMLRHLTDVQEEIRQVNINLDNKVDELAQANMRLYEMNMLKSDFLATMSHELRTPLNSILGFSEVLVAIDGLEEKQKRYVQNIQKSGKTLLEMINDILDLAKIESGKMETRPTDFRIAQVVLAQCDMARPLTERKNIDLDCGIEPDLPPMHQDQARVQQILNNLLSNAIKFTPDGGRIAVSAARGESGELVLQVGDTGVGIAEEDRQIIFEKFRQGRTAMPAGDTMTREHSGSGLGLSIVKEICRLLGGEIRLESELGKGSTFTVRLPWTLEEQPRLDATLAEGFEAFAKRGHWAAETG